MRPLASHCLVAVAFVVAACSSSSPATEQAATEPGPAPGAPTAPTPPSAAPPPTANDEAYAPLFVGRWDTTDPSGPRAAWPGTRVLARFEGTAVSVTLSDYAEEWMGGTPAYWEVKIDDGAWVPLAMFSDDTPHVFELAKDLAPGVHQVEIYKRSETQTGMTQFLGFDFPGGRGLAPPPRQTRHIEVMGDSQSTGFGVEMTDAPNTDCPGADHGGAYQNFRKAWGGRLGVRYDAEVHGTVFSGKGLLRNVTPDDPDGLFRYYPRTNPNPALQNSSPQLFDMTSWVPDVIVMGQGAVDFNVGVDRGEFATRYREFVVQTLRARAPDAHIYMAVVGKGGRDDIPGIAADVIAERKAAGDERMHLFVANLYEWTEMLACNGHGTPAWHQRIADELAAQISVDTGWP